MADSSSPSDLHVGGKHLLPTPPPSSEGAKRRKAHSMQYVTHTMPLFQPDDKPMDSAPDLESPGYMGIKSVPDTISDGHRVS